MTRRSLLLGGVAAGGTALVGCAVPCAPPGLSAGVVPGSLTFGELRHCSQENALALHGVDVMMPADAPSIISDYRSALDANLEARPFRHTGIDIAGIESRTPVLAAMDGLVDEAGYLRSGGNRVALYHATDDSGRELVTTYFHLSRIFVAQGAMVKRGEVLGLVGMTGTTSGSVPHLHYNVFAGRQLRQSHFLDYFYTLHVNPHLYWHNGPGRVTLFRPTASYPNRLGATYPVPGRAEADHFQRLVEPLL